MDCPVVGQPHFKVTSTLSKVEENVQIVTTYDIELNDVQPSDPTWVSPEYDFAPITAYRFIECIVADRNAQWESFKWSSGSFAGRLISFGAVSVEHSRNIPQDESGFDSGYRAVLALCNKDDDATARIPLICLPSSRTSVHIIIQNMRNNNEKEPIDPSDYQSKINIRAANAGADPYPIQATFDGGETTYYWDFQGQPPTISVALDAPGLLRVNDHLRTAAPIQVWIFTVWPMLAGYALSAFCILIAAALLLRQNRVYLRKIGLLAAALTAFGPATLDIAAGGVILAVGGWIALIAALSPSKRIRLFLLISAPITIGALVYAAQTQGWEHGYRGTPAVIATIVSTSLVLALILVGSIKLVRHPMNLFDPLAIKLPVDAAILKVTFGTLLGTLTFSWSAWLLSPSTYWPPLRESESDFWAITANDLYKLATTGRLNSLTLLILYIPLLILAILLPNLYREVSSRRLGSDRVANFTALILTLGAPWSQFETSPYYLNLPVWIFQYLASLAIFKWIIGSEAGGDTSFEIKPADRSELLAGIRRTSRDIVVDYATPRGPAIDEPVVARQSNLEALKRCFQDLWHRRAAIPRSHGHGGIDGAQAAQLLALGPKDGPLLNARFALRLSARLALVPVGYYAWIAGRDLVNRSYEISWQWQVLTIATGILLEFVRWLIIGGLFGLTYAKLPGSYGPLKALAFWAIWVVSCLPPVLFAYFVASGSAQQVIYHGAQMGLFLLILALVFDVATLHAAGGSWREIHMVYMFRNYGEVLAALAPALVLTFTLIQQVIAGTPSEIAESLLKVASDGVSTFTSMQGK